MFLHGSRLNVDCRNPKTVARTEVLVLVSARLGHAVL